MGLSVFVFFSNTDVDTLNDELSDLKHSEEEKAYRSELEKVSGKPSWLKEVELPSNLIKPSNQKEVRMLTNSILTAPCCQKSDQGSERKLKQNAKALYQVAENNFINPQIASYAIYNLIKRNRVNGWDISGLSNFYLKHFYYSKSENKCRNCKIANDVWDIVEIVAHYQHVKQREPLTAYKTIDNFIQRRGGEIAVNYRYTAAHKMARYLDFAGDWKGATAFIILFINDLNSEEDSNVYYYQYNQLLDSCAIYNSGECTQFTRKLKPPVQAIHDPKNTPKLQNE